MHVNVDSLLDGHDWRPVSCDSGDVPREGVLTRRSVPAYAPDVDLESVVVVKGADVPTVETIFIDDRPVRVARVDGRGEASLVALRAAGVGDVDVPVPEIDRSCHR